MNSTFNSGRAQPASTAPASAQKVEEQLARLFRHSARAGQIHPLQHLIQLHLQDRNP